MSKQRREDGGRVSTRFRIGQREMDILRWVGSVPWDSARPSDMADKWGITPHRVWEVAHRLKEKGMLVDAPPYALTRRGRQLLEERDGASGGGSGSGSGSGGTPPSGGQS